MREYHINSLEMMERLPGMNMSETTVFDRQSLHFDASIHAHKNILSSSIFRYHKCFLKLKKILHFRAKI